MTKTSNITELKLKLFCSTITTCLCVKPDLQDEEMAKVNCLCPNISLVPFLAVQFLPSFYKQLFCFVFEIRKQKVVVRIIFMYSPSHIFVGVFFPSCLSLSKSLLVVLIQQPTHFPIVFLLSRIMFFWTDILQY